MTIAVYDEIQTRRETAVRLISDFYSEKGDSVEISQFKEVTELTGSFRKNSYSVVFIGINSMRDIDAAWVIRDRDKKCPLVFISRSGDYSLEGYRLEVVNYLLEPLEKDRINQTLGRLTKEQHKGS